MSVVRYLPAILVLLAVGGLAAENFSHYPIGILSVLGIVHFVRNRSGLLESSDAKLLISIFACLWIPMLLSLGDAANPARAIKTTLLYLHYLPASLYVAVILTELAMRRIVLAGIALIVGFWCLDGIIQLVRGEDLFGYPYDGSVLKGVFYPKQRFGLILAVFAPLYLYVVHRLSMRSKFAWVLLLPLIIAVAFSLKRTAWVMLIVAIVGYLVCFFTPNRRNFRYGLIVAGFATAALVTSAFWVPNFQAQVQGTMKIFTTDFETADIASSRRLSLWKTGLAIAQSHWINGVGPRGYRTVYRDYAPSDDFWIARGSSGQTHPHLMLLEVIIETGLLGLTGYALALILIGRSAWSRRGSDPPSCAYLLVVLVAWFPLNAHLAFYGSYWSNIAWLMLALACASHRRDAS